MDLRYLSTEEIIAINNEVVKISGDPHGVMNEGNLRHLVDAIKFKYDKEPDCKVLKAAFLLDYLANKGHIFIEGNKRTAETAAFVFLSLNGIHLSVNQRQLADFVLSVARNERSLAAIARWILEVTFDTEYIEEE